MSIDVYNKVVLFASRRTSNIYCPTALGRYSQLQQKDSMFSYDFLANFSIFLAVKVRVISIIESAIMSDYQL